MLNSLAAKRQVCNRLTRQPTVFVRQFFGTAPASVFCKTVLNCVLYRIFFNMGANRRHFTRIRPILSLESWNALATAVSPAVGQVQALVRVPHCYKRG